VALLLRRIQMDFAPIALRYNRAVAIPATPMKARAESAALKRDLLLTSIVGILTELYAPRAIYLFGSRARGNHTAGSDYDLLVVVPDDTPRERRKSARAYERLCGTGAAVDILVCTESYFHSRTGVRTSLPARIMREGKTLYAA
jgi:predicted nucleotidyltransferase